MTTENGLEPTQRARRNIEVLRDRLEYLVNKQDARAYAGVPPEYVAAEVRALAWALPALEAEFDALARARRIIQELEAEETPALKRELAREKAKSRADRRREGATR